MQKSVRYNEGHALYLSVIARKEGTKRGFLSKKTTENSRWNEKYFALYQNVLFYFENDQSTRPLGIYLLEGCSCERVPAPKVSSVSKDAQDKQVCQLFWYTFEPFQYRTKIWSYSLSKSVSLVCYSNTVEAQRAGKLTWIT